MILIRKLKDEQDEKMSNIHFNTAFESLSYQEIDKWIKDNESLLIGSAIFSKNNSIISKIITYFERIKGKCSEFIPSHTGSIVKCDDEIYLFNVKPLFASKILLADYIAETDDDYILILKDFKLNNKKFSEDILEHEGDFYPFLSAIRSVGTKRKTKRVHCSELHLKTLQEQGLFKGINPEITPYELLLLLKRVIK